MRIALLTTVLLTACTVGEIGTSNNNKTDGGTPGTDGTVTGDDFTVCKDKLTPPDPAHIHTTGGTSNKGLNCIVAGCHLNNNLGPGAPGYQFAGTVYQAGNPTAPAAGAMVRIKSGTNILSAYADADGNFHFAAGSLSGTFTANTNVSGCPAVTPMVGSLTGGGGGGAGANSCNLCHAQTGGTTTPITL